MQVDRQTLLFFIIMFIFLSLPNGADQPHSTKDENTLATYQKSLKQNQKELLSSSYHTGYGNLTGLKMSYVDNLDNKNILDWPFHHYDKKKPWTENEKYSLFPNEVSDKIKDFWDTEPVDLVDVDAPAYLLNISGKVYGDFEVHKPKKELKKYSLPLPSYLQEYYDSYKRDQREEQKERHEQDPENNPAPEDLDSNVDLIGNFTQDSGKLSLSIKNYDYNFRHTGMSKFVYNKTTDVVDDSVVVEVRLNLVDYPEISRNELHTLGVYYQNTGSLIASTSSAKFSGVDALPHFAMNEDNFKKSQILMSQFLNMTDIDRDITMDGMNSDITRSVQQCEYIAFFQFEKTEYLKQQLQEIDEELMNPKGRPIPKEIPQIEVKSALLYSPDCGLIMNLKPDSYLQGNKTEVTDNQFKRGLSVFLVLVLLQLFLFIRQIKETRTPGQLSNISTTTLSMIGFQDSLIALFFLLVSTLTESLYLLFSCVAVISFIMCGVFEMRFIVSVLVTQGNERGTTWWEVLRGSVTRNETEEPGTTSANTEEFTANDRVPAAASPLPGINDEARYSNVLFASGFFLTIVSTFFILNVLTWRIKYRQIFEYVGLLGISSYWFPQFLRNTLKNRRRAFTWEFIIGTSMLRLIPIWYLCLYSQNPLRHRYDPSLAVSVFGCYVIQISLLFLQQLLGPRFWLNEKWLPKAYDYHPFLNMADLENGFASDILANIRAQEDDPGKSGIITCKVDCAICMNDIELPVGVNADSKKPKQPVDKLRGQQYMITPCRHIFHTDCLEDWMKYKLQCPVCRNALPPI